MVKSKKIRLGIIGAGLIWEKAHRPALAKLKNKFSISAFCARSKKTQKKIYMYYPEIPFFYDYRKMLKLDTIDAIIILTPIAHNAPFAIDSLKAGKHVIMEKPLATSVNEAKRVIETEKRSRKRVFILEQLQYVPLYDKVVSIMKKDQIGKIGVYNLIQHFPFYPGKNEYAKTKWRMKGEFPLGMIYDGGVHLISILTKLFGVPAYISAAGNNYRKEFGEYDHVIILFEYKNKLTGTFSYSSCMPFNAFFKISGLKGDLNIDKNNVTISVNNSKKKTFTFNEDKIFFNMWKYFADCIINNKKAVYDTKAALKDILVLDAIKRSLNNGKKVPGPY